MFWKLVVMVLTIGGTACGLLVLRQQEIDLLASETDLLRRAKKLEQSLQMTRWELEQLTQYHRFERWFLEQGIDLEPVDLDPFHLERVTEETELLVLREIVPEPDGDPVRISRGSNQRGGW